jgi:hypothetical protein
MIRLADIISEQTPGKTNLISIIERALSELLYEDDTIFPMINLGKPPKKKYRELTNKDNEDENEETDSEEKS